MSTQQINNALNELKSSVSQQVRNIKKDVSEFDTYKSNYEAIVNLPIVQKLMKENKDLKKRNRDLEKQLLAVLLETRRPIQKKKLLKPLYTSPPVSTSSSVYIKVEKDEMVQQQDEVVIIEKKVENIVYEILEDSCNDIIVDAEEEVEQEVVEEEVVEEEVVEEEVVEEEVVEEEVEVEVEVEVEEEVEEEEVEEEEVEEEAEQEVEEEEVEVEVEEEVVQEEEEEEGEESGEVYEVTIKGKTYYVMNETDSIIYDVDENGDVSLEVGIYKSGKPTFNKK